MKYMAEDDSDGIQEFGERMAGPGLSRDIARLYSQHTRLRGGAPGLSSWTDDELLARLEEAERLLVAGMATADSSDQRRYLRRAGEIFEWAATIASPEMPVPVVLLAASAYQLAGYPARASGTLSEHPLSDKTSRVLTALLRADFPQAQRLLLDTWRLAGGKKAEVYRVDAALLDQLLRALGVLTAWLRWGDDARIETALTTLEKVSHALRYDSDGFSWLLAVVFAAIGRTYQREALWTALSPLMTTMAEDGHRALTRYARVAFLEKKVLTWPSQQAGISGIMSEGSFALCTPTGSGKTRVAELVILRHLFGQVGTDSDGPFPLVLYLAPSRALSAEVESCLSRSFRSIRATGVAVTSLYGGNDIGPSDLARTREQPTVLISTHEKADALLRFLGPELLGQVTCVIVDEAHTVAFTGKYEELTKAQSRSLRLEGLVSRLRSRCPRTTTFVALSAVAGELKDTLSEWISGVKGQAAIAPDYRSTRQLFGRLECSQDGGTTIRCDVLDGQRLAVGDQESAPYVPSPFPPHPPTGDAFQDGDSVAKRMRAHLLWAAMHSAQPWGGRRRSVLVYVTEHPEWYAKTFLDLLSGPWSNATCPDFYAAPDEGRSRALLDRCLASCADYFGTDSREHQLLERGIVLHHGKMPSVMSRLLIELTQSHVINIVVATSTLSEGVNLPFETVLIPSLRRREKMVSPKEIASVAGRAGRAGVSTEGRSLVLLARGSQEWTQAMARKAYGRVVSSMVQEAHEETREIRSPLYALIHRIAEQWSHVSGSTDRAEFIAWLETAVSPQDGEGAELLESVDTLDQQLLAGIVEAESLVPEVDLEDALQSLWRNTLARWESDEADGDHLAREVFVKRGAALVESIYPDSSVRRALYNTGLPPRDGRVLVDRLSDIKNTLLEGLHYASWSTQERLQYLTRLVEMTSEIEAFGVRDVQIGRGIGWPDVLAWWMAPDFADHVPSPKSVSRWYNFASKHFIYGLNWALGAIIGSILERDGGNGELLDRWQRCELPWSVFWFKDMVTWGTLDPIASCALARKVAYTRPVAASIASQYWEGIDEITDAALEPKLVSEWMRRREGAMPTATGEQYQAQGQMPVSLVEDFSEHRQSKFRVLPAIGEDRIDWYDPAGFVLARSDVPEDWQSLDVATTDFMLDPAASLVTWEPYV